jgi:hypothetical protein
MASIEFDGQTLETEVRGPAGTAAPRKDENEPMLYCPVCSERLSERQCKLFCRRCGYYMSCADYY